MGLLGVLAATLALPAFIGCGAPAAPQPPTLNLPQPVSDLAAMRTGNTVRLTWTVSAKTTDKLPIRGAMTAVLCRRVDSGACVRTSTQTVRPQQSADAVDTLPTELSTGMSHLLTYQLTLQNSGGKAAAASNPAYSAAGDAPIGVTAFIVTPSRSGIVLGWQPEATPGQSTLLRFERTLSAGAPAAPADQPGLLTPRAEQEPREQSLEVAESAAVPAGQPARALDATAVTGRTYRYTAQRTARITIAGQPVAISSAPTAPVSIEYRDVFPPPTPTGLVTAADSSGHTIDLSWSPVSDPHLSGYVVYRRTVSGTEPPQRLTPLARPLTVTAWSDATAKVGERYAYSLTAIDLAGNESARSPEVEETLPPATPQP